MLFDLTSPRRKRIIRVVYGLLALLFFVGFVGFGVGGNFGGGGLLDALGIGGDDSGDGVSAEQYKQQIEDAEAKLDANPEDPRALANLAQYRYLSGQVQLAVDEQTGVPSLTEESRGEFERAIDAWSRYLGTDPAKPDVGAAGQIIRAYVFLNDAGGAAEAQQILADANPSGGTYATLAYYRYADFDFKRGDEAAKQAVENAEPGQSKQLEKELDRLRKQAEEQKKAIDALPKGEELPGGPSLGDPLGGLGGASTGLPPTTP